MISRGSILTLRFPSPPEPLRNSPRRGRLQRRRGRMGGIFRRANTAPKSLQPPDFQASCAAAMLLVR